MTVQTISFDLSFAQWAAIGVMPTSDLVPRVAKGLGEGRRGGHYRCGLCGRVYNARPGLRALRKIVIPNSPNDPGLSLLHHQGEF